MKYSKSFQIRELFYFLLNCGYNLYYKLFNKQILTQKDRYVLMQYLDSNDPETKIFGLRLLTEYCTGTDKVSDCSMRITWDEDKPIEKRHYFKFGNLRMSETITIQEVIDEICNALNNNEISEALKYERIIGYYFAYHPRIGGQVSSAYWGDIRYPAPFQDPKIYVNDSNVHTWDWYRSKWAFPVKAKEYWKHHKKPTNLFL